MTIPKPIELRLLDKPLSGDNLILRPEGKRRCRTCKRAQDRKQSAKKRAARAAERESVRDEIRKALA